MAATLPNMGLHQWNLPGDPFSYTELADDFLRIDNHDHTTGKGLQIPTGGIASLAVTGPKIAADAIDASKILDGSVAAAELATNSVTTVKITDLNVTTAKLAANAVTAAKIEAQQVWQTIALTNFTATTLKYFKDSLGIVHFRGDQMTTTGTPPTLASVIGTLPAGYRPVSTQYFVVHQMNAVGYWTVGITAAGVMTNDSPGTMPVSGALTFGGIHFRAEN